MIHQTPDDALRAALAESDADALTPAAELTGAQVIGDDVLLELVLPLDAYRAAELRLGGRYDLSEVMAGGRSVPVIVSSSIALTPTEIAAFLTLTQTALRLGGSVSLAVDETDTDRPWAVIATVNDGRGGAFTARGDTSGEALDRAAQSHWDETPMDGLR